MPRTEAELTELFGRLGAPDPAEWASSQASEGINQLHRFLFLRQAWGLVVKDGDTDWIANLVANATRDPDGPYAGIGAPLKRLLDAGADAADIADVVRKMQAELLFSFCYLLDDPAIAEPELADIGWRLVETDEDFQPTDRPIGGLHESVLETDPAGR